MRNHFVEEPSVTAGSAFVEKTVDRWIAGIPLDERREFVDNLFDVIEATGTDNVSDLLKEGLKKPLELLKSFSAMDPEDQKRIREVLWQLVRTGADVLREGQ